MSAKINQTVKKENKFAKKQKIDRATNKFMINLSWGIFVIILIRIIENGFTGSAVLKMPVVMKVLAAVFAVVAACLFVCGGMNILKNRQRVYDYAIFATALTVGSLIIGFYPKIRLLMGGISPRLLNIDSRWWFSWGLIVAVIAYLVIMFTWTVVRIAMIERKK